jgi:predicted amidophosphoribosyltransferase
MDVARALLAVVLPVRCLVCGRGEELLCPECRAGLLVLRGTLCARCGAPTAWPVERCGECAGRRLSFASARAAIGYDATGRALLSAWKERGIGRVADLAGDLVAATVPKPPVEALTFVPGEGDRVGWRGVNTAEELARALGRRWKLPVEGLLERTRRVRPQRGLTRAERRTNIRAAFRARGALPPPPAVGLVDDVYTTGATVSVAARALKVAGARRVHVVTFARAVR